MPNAELARKPPAVAVEPGPATDLVATAASTNIRDGRAPDPSLCGESMTTFCGSIRSLTTLACLFFGIGSGCAYLESNARKQAVEAQQLVQEAREAHSQQDANRATQLLSEAIALNPRDADAHRELARSLATLGRAEDSIQQLRFAAELEPDDPIVWIQLSELYLQQKNYQLADEAIQKALSVEPANVEALWTAAQIEEARDRKQQAIQYCHRIFAIEPRHVPASLLTARMHIANYEPDRAGPLLRQVAEIRSLPPDQLAESEWQLGIAYGQQRRWDDAAAALEGSLEHKPDPTADDYYRIAFAELQAGNSAAAIHQAEQAALLEPTHDDAQTLLAAIRQANASASGTLLAGGTPRTASQATDGIIQAGMQPPRIRVPAGW